MKLPLDTVRIQPSIVRKRTATRAKLEEIYSVIQTVTLHVVSPSLSPSLSASTGNIYLSIRKHCDMVTASGIGPNIP